MSEISFKKLNLDKITTGSLNFDNLLGGGLPVASITDVYGAAGTGKTQFAFQNAIMTCEQMRKSDDIGPNAVFVDCTGSFRPERIVEISESRSLDAKEILERIYTVSVRSVEDQKRANHRVESDVLLSKCRILIIDDVTSNFVIEFNREEDVAARQTAISLYSRHLAYIANKKGISVLLTNSARSRGDQGEGETTGEILSQFSLYSIHFTRRDRNRFAILMQPSLTKTGIKFEIETSGIR